MSNSTLRILDLDPDQLNNAAGVLKAMAHPLRIAIIGYLEKGNELNVTEIHELLEVEQSTASHHLGILKDKGVLSSRRDGKHTFYSLRHDKLTNIIECISKCGI